MVRNALARFMYGRNGTDQLGLFSLGVYLFVWFLQMITDWGILVLVDYVLLFIILYRMLSRRLDRRRAENAKFLQAIQPARKKFRSLRNRMQDKDHRYFKCPSCGQQMRVPKGKGRITVHCRSCGTTFEEKS